jgi:DNA-binding IclR family transcriptional regulator
MSNHTPAWLAAADAAILATFRNESVQYPALIASRSGLHIPYAEQRCQALVDHGLLEQSSDEIAYRLTAEGQRYLAGASEQDTPP